MEQTRRPPGKRLNVSDGNPVGDLDGRDEKGATVAAGVYVLRLSSALGTLATEQMVVMR